MKKAINTKEAQKDIINKIHGREQILIPGDGQYTSDCYIQSAGFSMENKHCFYIYDKNKQNPGMVYLSLTAIRRLIYFTELL